MNLLLRHFAALVLFVLSQRASLAAAPRQETGFLDRAATVRGVEYLYQVYVPREYDPHRAWPIILELHGGGEYGSDGMRPTVGALAQSHVFYPAIVSASVSDRYAAVAQQLKSLPIWIFHGDADMNVSVEESRHMAAALRSVGANVQYTELPGVDHNAWDPAYDSAEMAAWLLAQRRQ